MDISLTTVMEQPFASPLWVTSSHPFRDSSLCPWILPSRLEGWHYYTHFASRETEAQRGEVIGQEHTAGRWQNQQNEKLVWLQNPVCKAPDKAPETSQPPLLLQERMVSLHCPFLRTKDPGDPAWFREQPCSQYRKAAFPNMGSRWQCRGRFLIWRLEAGERCPQTLLGLWRVRPLWKSDLAESIKTERPIPLILNFHY